MKNKLIEFDNAKQGIIGRDSGSYFQTILETESLIDDLFVIKEDILNKKKKIVGSIISLGLFVTFLCVLFVLYYSYLLSKGVELFPVVLLWIFAFLLTIGWMGILTYSPDIKNNTKFDEVLIKNTKYNQQNNKIFVIKENECVTWGDLFHEDLIDKVEIVARRNKNLQRGIKFSDKAWKDIKIASSLKNGQGYIANEMLINFDLGSVFDTNHSLDLLILVVSDDLYLELENMEENLLNG